MRVNRIGVVALLAAVVVMALGACMLDVDESLVDRRPAAAEAGSASLDGASLDGASLDDASRKDVSAPGMPCGTSVCSPRDAICCTGGFGETDRTKGTCVAAARSGDCKSGDWWECMRPSDCAGASSLRCCANHYAGGSFSKALCQDTCAADATELCDPSAASPCDPGRTCIASAGFPGLHECTRP